MILSILRRGKHHNVCVRSMFTRIYCDLSGITSKASLTVVVGDLRRSWIKLGSLIE